MPLAKPAKKPNLELKSKELKINANGASRNKQGKLQPIKSLDMCRGFQSFIVLESICLHLDTVFF